MSTANATTTSQLPPVVFPERVPATPLQGGLSLPLQALGQGIVARIAAGDKRAEGASQMYISAGCQLIEAKRLVPDFKAFLRDHCNGLSRSHAGRRILYRRSSAQGWLRRREGDIA
jgi:hypothetical protein